MTTKVLLGGLIGGIAMFLLGFLIFGMLLEGTMSGYSNASCVKTMEEINMPFLIASNLLTGLAIAYIFSRWAGVSTFSGGAKAGAVLGLLFALSVNLFIYGMSNLWTDPMAVVVDTIGSIVIWTIAGGLVGWWMGRK